MRSSMEEATTNTKSIGSVLSSATCAIIFTIKDKIDINNKFPGKPPRRGLGFSSRGREAPAVLLSTTSAHDLRALDHSQRVSAESVDGLASPSDVTEECTRYSSDSEASSSSKASSSSTDIVSIQNASLWKGFLRAWRLKSLRRLSSFPPLGVGRLPKWKSSREGHSQSTHSSADSDFCIFKPSWKTFTTLELQNATNNFSEENLIGKGGFAEVFEGQLDDGQFVAVKRLTNGTLEERIHNFLSELGILVHINHPNIARLIGVGDEQGLNIVLSLSPHGSLSAILHGSRGGDLNWGMRNKIAVGTAEGLEYLHERCQRRIIHRDIKAANILLTEDFEPQICDFGLAKWLPDQLTHHTVSSFEGTFGYLAPEYFTHGIVDEKTDVFAFGVLLLELISGRKALDAAQQSLLMWAKPLIERNEIKALVDPALGENYDYEQLRHVLEVASMCIQQSPKMRPRISEVVVLLKGEGGSPSFSLSLVPSRRRTYSEELFDAEEYNATKYLNDMNRHKQTLDLIGESE